jgi:hypothetical protein
MTNCLTASAPWTAVRARDARVRFKARAPRLRGLANMQIRRAALPIRAIAGEQNTNGSP